MTQDATNTDLWTYTFTATAQEYSFKITSGKWQSEDPTAYEANYSNVDADSPIKLKGEGSGDITFTSNAGDVVISFNASTQKVSVTMKDGNNPDPEPIDTENYYIKHPWGDGKDASWGWKVLTADANGTTYSITDVYGGRGCNWRKGNTDSNGTWVETPTLVGEPAIGDSATFTLDPAAGTITITKITATSVETTTTLTAPEKIIRNGQIYIVRENVLYTVTGQAVK